MAATRERRARSCKQPGRQSKRVHQRKVAEGIRQENERLRREKQEKRQRVVQLRRRKREAAARAKQLGQDVNKWRKTQNSVRSQIARARFHQTMLDVYDQQSSKSANREKLVPKAELCKARIEIEQSKLRIIQLMTKLQEDARNQGQCIKEKKKSKNGIPLDVIVCAICSSGDSTEQDNDILLCDLQGCNKAFHQQCLIPHVTTSELSQLKADDPWFCHACTCSLHCLNDINEEFNTSYDSIEALFPRAQQELAKHLQQLDVLRSEGTTGSEVDVNSKMRKCRSKENPNQWKLDNTEDSWGSDSDSENWEGSCSETEDESCDEGEEPVVELMSGKRKRSPVDYVALANKLFKSNSNDGTQLCEDDDSADDASYGENSGLTANELGQSLTRTLLGSDNKSLLKNEKSSKNRKPSASADKKTMGSSAVKKSNGKSNKGSSAAKKTNGKGSKVSSAVKKSNGKGSKVSSAVKKSNGKSSKVSIAIKKSNGKSNKGSRTVKKTNNRRKNSASNAGTQ